MDRIAEVEIRKVERTSFFRVPEDLNLKNGDWCILEFTQGTQDFGRLLTFQDTRNFFRLTVAGKVLRPASPEDLAVIRENFGKKPETMKLCQERIKANNLAMKLIDVEYSFDRSKITFYYWAEGRVDFRKLVKDLAGIFNCRIEMRQIGLRDEAKIKGGCGICGRPLCCALFLKNFESITMRMAKNQKLPLDMNKITGLCGRLLCCLSYEESAYKEKDERTVVPAPRPPEQKR